MWILNLGVQIKNKFRIGSLALPTAGSGSATLVYGLVMGRFKEGYNRYVSLIYYRLDFFVCIFLSNERKIRALSSTECGPSILTSWTFSLEGLLKAI